jgi:hypothetical protein
MKTVMLSLAVLLFSTTLSGCSVMLTPYERAKIHEQGGTVKKKKEGGEEEKGSDTSSAENGKKTDREKKKAADHKPSHPGRAETVAEMREREKGQGLFYVYPQILPKPNVVGKDTPPKQALKGETRTGNYKAKSQAKFNPAAKPEPPQPEKRLEDKKPHLLFNAFLSKEVSKVEGVDSSIVLIDDELNAFVALNPSDGKKADKGEKPPIQKNEILRVQSEGEIPVPLQEKVAAKVRGLNPLVKTVHITNNPEHVERIQRYAVLMQRGEPVDLHTQALAEHIQDIWN